MINTEAKAIFDEFRALEFDDDLFCSLYFLMIFIIREMYFYGEINKVESITFSNSNIFKP